MGLNNYTCFILFLLKRFKYTCFIIWNMEEDYIKAGKIAAEALKYGAGLIKPGASWIDVADKIE